jgi:gliding motility-associated-like protein
MKRIFLIIVFLQCIFLTQAQTLDSTDNYCIGKEQTFAQFEDWSRPRVFDFDNDGDKDFAILEGFNDSLAVYLNNGSADFAATPPLKISVPNGLVDLGIYDFDADGFIDAVAIADNGDLYFYKNVAGTMFSSAGTLANTIMPNLAAHMIEVHDLNNDGKVDIIGSGQDYALNDFYAFTFQGTGGFSFIQMSPMPIFSLHNAQFNLPQTHFAFADFDADGFQDFVIGCEDLTDTLEIYTNAATTTNITYLAVPATYTIPTTGFPNYLIARDCNGDGMPDISVSSSGGFSINKNLGSSMMFTSMMVDASLLCQQFDFADMNSDNKKELITSNYGDYKIYTGNSVSGISVGTVPNNFNLFDRRAFALADLDGNSTNDFLFVGTGDAPYMQISRNFSFHIENLIVSTNSVICGSTPVQFTVTNSDPSYPGIYSWTPGPATGMNYTATSAGGVSCAFSYTLPPGLGQCTLLTDTIFVNSQVSPSAVINSNASAITCQGSSVDLVASVVPASTTYTWSTGVSTSSISVTPSVTTTYSLFMDNGCQSTAMFTVNITPNPTVTISSSVTTICLGDSVMLNGNGAVTYQWGPVSSTASSIVVKPTVNTTYGLTGTSSSGCSDTTIINIIVNTAPVLSVVSSKTLICFPDTVTLSASGSPTYTWSTGSNASSIPIIVFSNTNFTVSGSNGCKATAVFSVTGSNRPIVTANSNFASVCLGDPVMLQAFGAASYTWAPPFQFGSTVFDNPTVPTTYSVLGISANGCYNYATVSVGIFTVSPVSILAGSSEICIGKPVDFIASGAVTYSWNTGSNNSFIQVTPSNMNPLSYSVAATDANGCKSTASQSFNVSDKCQLVIYNGVTPNGDGKNDIFFLENIEQYPGNNVSIYNRWGQRLADIHDYDNKKRFWSGSNEDTNNHIPSGTYYYIIDLGNGSDLLKGWIELTKKDLN